MGSINVLQSHDEIEERTKKMIEAVVAVIDDGGPPPPILILAWDVERWGTLPEAGGLYDQDAAILNEMNVLGNVYKAVSRLRNAHGDDIHRLTDGDRRIIGELRRSGVL